jgi:hypothetical protein
MKLSQITSLIKEAIGNEDYNEAKDILDVLEINKSKIPNKTYQQLHQILVEFIGDKKQIDKKNNVELITYDFNKFENKKPSWYELWDKKEHPTFSQFFHHYIISTFHKLPDSDVQHPIMSSFALFNTASIPNEGKKPNGICCGFSRTGKSKFAERCCQLLPKRNVAIIKGNNSPLAITEKIHKVCYISGDEKNLIVAPSVCKIDNIYWQDFIRRLDIHYVSLLALEKGDAICEIAGKQGGVYHTFSKYVFTTVEPPIRNEPRMDELLNRSFVFYFDKGYQPDFEPSLYNWTGFDEEYKKLWEKEDVETKFFPVLSDVMKLNSKDCDFSLEKLEISKIMIATGLYLGIYESIEEALQLFSNYWNFSDNKTTSSGDLMFKIVECYLQDYYYLELHLRKKKKHHQLLPPITINLEHLQEYVKTKSSSIVSLRNNKTFKELENLMLNHDLIIQDGKNGMEFIKRSDINNTP